MEESKKKNQKKNQKKIYIILAILAVLAIVFIGLGASGTLTNWIAKYQAEKNYEQLLASASDVTDEMTLRQLLLLDEEIEITVNKDIEIRTAFTVNGTKTLRGGAVLSSNLGILQPISILDVTPGSKLTMDGLVIDGNGNAIGVKVQNGAELTYLSGEIIYAGTYGIAANGLVTIEDVTISDCTTAAIDAGFMGEVYFKGGQLVDNRHIGVYVEAQGYMEITDGAVIDGTSGQGIRNRGELVINGGEFKNIGKFVVSNHNKVTIDYTGNNGEYIKMTDIGQGVIYNSNTATSNVKDVYATNLGTDAYKCVGGTLTVENCVVDQVKAHGLYASFGKISFKDVKVIGAGLTGIYALSPAEITVESFELEDIGTRGIMSKGAAITGNNVTIDTTGTFGVSNQPSSDGITSTNEYTNLTIKGAKTNSVNNSGGSTMIITDSVLGESGRTNVYVGKGEVTFNDVEIEGSAADNCAAITVSSAGTCTMTGNSKIHGKGIRGVNISGTFNMQGGEIYGYSSKKQAGGAVRLYKGGVFNLSGGSIHDNTTNYGGGAVYLNANTTFNMTGGKIYKNTATTTGGAVQVEINSVFNMKGGSIENNKTLKASGGAVFILGKMKMSGGTIAKNTSATVGGAINLNAKTDSKTKEKIYGEFTMTGGTMKENSSTGNGGAIHISGGTTVTMSGGRITDNVSAKDGSGINQNGNFTMSGSAYVGNNVITLGGTKKVVTVAGESLSAHNAQDPLLIEPSFGAEKGTIVAKCESAAISANVLGSTAPGNKAYASFAQNAENIIIGSYNENIDMNMAGADTVYVSNFQELKEAVESTTSKRYVVISSNIQMEGAVTVPEGTTVYIKDDGTARTLTREDGSTSSFFRTSFGTGLYIAGTREGNLVLDGKTSGKVNAEKVSQLVIVRGATEISNVTFKDNETPKLTGAFVRHLYGPLNIVDSTFDNGYANAGGAISSANGTATVTNCTFTGNETKSGGGAIRVEKSASMTVNGSAFTGNSADTVGGAINCDNGTLTVANTTFADNTSKGTSGAVNLTNKSTATITDSTFDGNKSTADNAGAIKVNKSSLVLNGTTFVDNTTPENGGAIFVEGKINDSTYANVTATGCTFKTNSADKTGGAIKGETGVVITLADSDFIQNTSKGTTGGAIDLYRSTVNATDCTFEKNTANTYGGAIYLNKEAVANLTGCDFTENVGTTLGGAIYVFETGEAIADSCTFTSNSSGKYEGGAIANKGKLTATNSVFTSNIAKTHGGAIYAADESTLNTVTNCTFDGNKSGKNGAAILVESQATVTVSGGTFQSNVAGNEGGAIYTSGTLETTANCGFTGNTSTGSGGAVYVNTGATATFTNTSFTQNKTEEQAGGAIYTKGAITASTCTFTTNEAKTRGGAIWVNGNAASANVSDSTFTTNTSGNTGGAFEVNGGTAETVILSDCRFDSNNATNNGDAVYVRTGKAVTISGGTFVNDGKEVAFESNSNMGQAIISGTISGVTFKYSQANKAGLVIGEEGIAGSDITITPKAYIEGHVLVTKTDAATDATLKEAASIIKVTDNGDGVEWVVESDGTIDAVGTLQKVAAQNKETGVKYTSIQAAVNAAQSGETIYVLYDMEVEKAITVSGGKNVIITNAPDKDIIIIRAFTGSLFTVDSTSTLTLGSTDTAKKFTIDGGYDADAATPFTGKLIVNNGGIFNLLANATVQNASARTSDNKDGRSYGGALYNTGIANLAGNFTGNKGYNGGAVYNADGTLNITGGVYSGNIGAGQGGAVYVASGTDSASIANAEMTQNDVTAATSKGVAIYVQGGASALTLENCNIHNNVVEYKDDTDIGSDVMVADNTTLNLKDNVNVGVIHQRYGDGNDKPYAVINVKENYTGKVVIVPNNGNFVVGETQLVSFDSEMTTEEKAVSAGNIIVRKVTDGVNDDTTYCVDTNGIIQYKSVRIGTTTYNTLQDAVNAVESGKTETTVIEVLYPTVVSETIAIADNKNITITNVAGSDITLTRAFEGTLFTVDSTSKLTLGSEETTNTFIVDGGSVADDATEAEVQALINNANEFVLQSNATLQNADAGEGVDGGALYTTGTAKIYGTVKGNSAENGGAIYVQAGSLEAEDAIFSGNESAGNGGAINSNYGATVTLDGCRFYQNKSVSSGGAVYSRYKLETKNNCVFEENEVTKSGSSSGGAICVYDGSNNNAVTIISNTQFTKNIAKNRSSAIDINGGEDKDKGAFTTISDCTFSQNDANGTDSTIQLRVTGYVELSDCTFSGTLDGGQDIIYFYDKNSVKPTMGIEGVISNVQFKNVWADQIIVNGAIDESSITVKPKTYAEGTIILKKGDEAEAGVLEPAAIIIKVAADANGDEWFIGHDGKLVKATTAAQVGSDYYTDVNSAINAAIASEDAQATVYVYNGDELNMAEAITIASGRTLVITNGLGKEVELTRTQATTLFNVAEGGVLTIGSNMAGSITVDGGYVADAQSPLQAASLISNAGTFTLEANATIQNAVFEGVSGNLGGALNNTGEATLKGTIAGCSAFNGGAVYNAANAILNVDGASFTQNFANTGNGGAIRNSGTLIVEDATFTENRTSIEVASRNGGAIHSDGTVNVSNTAFNDNYAYASGGAIYSTGSKCEITNCDFDGNNAEHATGGAVYASRGLNISGGTYSANEAATSGGAIQVAAADALISRVKMYNNILTTGGTGGGAIYVGSGKSLTISDSEIYGNTTSNNQDNGWDICVHKNGTLNVSGGINTSSETLTQECIIYKNKDNKTYYVQSDGVTLETTSDRNNTK